MGKDNRKDAASLKTRQSSLAQERRQLRAELPIGARMRQLRVQRRLTQEQVASLLALNRTAYTHYENGVNMPDILTLVRLATIYEVSPGELLRFLTLPEEAAGEQTG